jgi:hypothetical protein
MHLELLQPGGTCELREASRRAVASADQISVDLKGGQMLTGDVVINAIVLSARLEATTSVCGKTS